MAHLSTKKGSLITTTSKYLFLYRYKLLIIQTTLLTKKTSNFCECVGPRDRHLKFSHIYSYTPSPFSNKDGK